MITEYQSFRECEALAHKALLIGKDNEERLEALRACVAHPCAYHELDLPELYYDLGELLCTLKRYDESLEAFEAAIASGAQSLPHPRANVAEVLLQAGRRDEADATFAELRRRYPDDIWLYNFAGLAYVRAGCYREALTWLEQGIAISLEGGDRDRILGQLNDERNTCRNRLGLGNDELSAQLAAFERPETKSWPFLSNTGYTSLGEAYPDHSPCGYCGWDPSNEGHLGAFFDDPEWLAQESYDLSGRAIDPDFKGVVRGSKTGRNAPCLCSSGRKYKHCCGV